MFGGFGDCKCRGGKRIRNKLREVGCEIVMLYFDTGQRSKPYGCLEKEGARKLEQSVQRPRGRNMLECLSMARGLALLE